MPWKYCVQCGTGFNAIKNQRFCSPECSVKSGAHRRRLPERTLKCAICNKTFETVSGNQKYCSPQCSGEASRIRSGVKTAMRLCPHCGERL